MSWFAKLPQGARALVVIVAVLIGGSLVFASGSRIGHALHDVVHDEEGE